MDLVVRRKRLSAVANRSQRPWFGLTCLLAYYAMRALSTEWVQCRELYISWAAIGDFPGKKLRFLDNPLTHAPYPC